MFKKQGVFNDTSIVLWDKHLNVKHPLHISDYVFETNTNTNEDRFVILYEDEKIHTLNIENLNDENLTIYQQDDKIHIENKNLEMDKITVFDFSGRLILSKNINTYHFEESFDNFNGLLLLKIELKSGKSIIKKWIIKP